jgi:hypothetical protein
VPGWKALPDLDDCRRFCTLGPSGPGVEDINGRAVSIELFLDLSAIPGVEPAVRWTAYDEVARQYQGKLLQKAEHTQHFLTAAPRGQAYEYGKLMYLWKHLVEATTMPLARVRSRHTL